MADEKPFHILLAEDDDDHAELLLYKLESIGIQNTHYRVKDGEEVLTYLNNSTNPIPNLILLDMKMPKLNGHEVLEQIKKSLIFCNIPVIMLTTSDAKQDRIKAYRNHANSYLVKPMDFDELSKMLSDLLHYWSVWHISLSDKEYQELQDGENL